MNKFSKAFMCVCLAAVMSSCYSYTTVVGKGAQTGLSKSKMNHYLIYGLVPLSTSDAKQMANGASDYEVTTRITFLDGLINGITFGFYTPSTTTVTR